MLADKITPRCQRICGQSCPKADPFQTTHDGTLHTSWLIICPPKTRELHRVTIFHASTLYAGQAPQVRLTKSFVLTSYHQQRTHLQALVELSNWYQHKSPPGIVLLLLPLSYCTYWTPDFPEKQAIQVVVLLHSFSPCLLAPWVLNFPEPLSSPIYRRSTHKQPELVNNDCANTIELEPRGRGHLSLGTPPDALAGPETSICFRV